MFDLIAISDSEYQLKESSGELIGRFILKVDFLYYFELSEKRRSGVLPERVLIEIGRKLKNSINLGVSIQKTLKIKNVKLSISSS